MAGVSFAWPRDAPGAQETPRAKELGQKLMCVCGCNQILTACNHVGCQYSHKMLQELDQLVARNDSDDLILQAFVQEYGPTVLGRASYEGLQLGRVDCSGRRAAHRDFSQCGKWCAAGAIARNSRPPAARPFRPNFWPGRSTSRTEDSDD